MPGLRLPPCVSSAPQNKLAPLSLPFSPPRQCSKRAAVEDNDERGAKRQRHESAAPPATTTATPLPQGTKQELSKLEERRDLVAAKYQDLPLRLRRHVRFLHTNEQFVLAVLLQYINTPYAAAALPDVEALALIAELCPRDENLLCEAKPAIVLRKIAAAHEMLDMIEAMRVQHGIDVNGAVRYGRQFLAGWIALDDLVATKYEERRFFHHDTSSLFKASDRATETTEFESETECEVEDGEKTEETGSNVRVASSVSSPTAEFASKRTKADIDEAYAVLEAQPNGLHEQFRKEWKRWHEDMLDRRTKRKHLPVEQRPSQIVMIKAIYNGIMSLT
ncbi:hypothetical protein DOTSEDRAFT_26824 [Dothistroma septosporum NZE10]|uniref:Uncharacterized protein n=1 Tax=Dothistroma septosporum (strain NZE10 / CBS 128990) TaxID=675120 RepID=N1PGG3_DOTSN|nr:hypothetical protein DOTSEDRAFT_26824 [Dothistroma septosporum NZE10]